MVSTSPPNSRWLVYKILNFISYFVLSCSGSPGNSACLLARPSVVLPALSAISSQVPSNTSRLNRWKAGCTAGCVGPAANCPFTNGAATKLKTELYHELCLSPVFYPILLNVWTILTVVWVTVTGSCISPNTLLSSACRHNIITAAQSLSTFLVVVCVSGDGLLGVGGPGPGAVQLVEPLDTREVGQNCPVPQIEVHRPRLREADQRLQPVSSEQMPLRP